MQGHEDRRFAQPATQPDADHAKNAPQQERQAPGVIENLCRCVDPRQRRCGQGAQQVAEGQAGLEETQGMAAMMQRRMFSHEHPGAGHLAAHRRTLEDTQRQ
ncbi:hypothetical protein D9M68_994500 [compost metagenome]